MTIYARPPRTLAVECHNDALWLCAVSGDRSELLARFSDPAHAEAFKAIHAAAKAHAHAAGQFDRSAPDPLDKAARRAR